MTNKTSYADIANQLLASGVAPKYIKVDLLKAELAKVNAGPMTEQAVARGLMIVNLIGQVSA